MKTQNLQSKFADLLAFAIGLSIYTILYVVAVASHIGALESEGFGDEQNQ